MTSELGPHSQQGVSSDAGNPCELVRRKGRPDCPLNELMNAHFFDVASANVIDETEAMQGLSAPITSSGVVSCRTGVHHLTSSASHRLALEWRRVR